jgi:phospholipid/cholesterol/gamma-HCH transport system permease protein
MINRNAVFNRFFLFVRDLGERFIEFVRYVGGISILFWKSIFWLFFSRPKFRHILDQMHKIGVSSFPIVFLISLFTGIVLALQSAYQLEKMSAKVYIASLVALSMCRELGPVLTALAIAGRVGASITAELGSMKVTEQIDALETLGSNPVKYLVVPRFVALIVMLPILTAYSDFIGIVGGYALGVWKLGIGSSLYIRTTWNALAYKDVFTGLLKAFVFGSVIASVSCYEGFETTGGAEGVGKATTLSVVSSFILIIAVDCLITAVFYFLFP